MSSRTCTTCGTNDLTGGCGMNAVEWGPTNDGMMEARLLTMLEAKTPVDTIMEELAHRAMCWKRNELCTTLGHVHAFTLATFSRA